MQSPYLKDIPVYLVVFIDGEPKKLKLNEKQEELFDELIDEYYDENGYMQIVVENN